MVSLFAHERLPLSWTTYCIDSQCPLKFGTCWKWFWCWVLISKLSHLLWQRKQKKFVQLITISFRNRNYGNKEHGTWCDLELERTDMTIIRSQTTLNSFADVIVLLPVSLTNRGLLTLIVDHLLAHEATWARNRSSKILIFTKTRGDIQCKNSNVNVVISLGSNGTLTECEGQNPCLVVTCHSMISPESCLNSWPPRIHPIAEFTIQILPPINKQEASLTTLFMVNSVGRCIV